MHPSVPSIVLDVVARFSQFSLVESVVLGGSHATFAADHSSDFDLYILTTDAIDLEARRAIARSYSSTAEIDNQFFGSEDGWGDDATGTRFDIVYWSTDWLQDQLDRLIVRHEGSVGYSTSFWYTILHAVPQYDRDGWFARLQLSARAPYPELLRHRILALNFPLLRSSQSSFLKQIVQAQHRRDLVAVQHRLSAYLSSYFDTLFALNHLPHPGEKRLIETAERTCRLRSVSMPTLVESMLTIHPLSHLLVDWANQLTDDLESLLREEGLIEQLP